MILAPRGAWLRQKSCQEISCCRSGDIKEVSFAWLFKTEDGSAEKQARAYLVFFLNYYRGIIGAVRVFF
jgi:hypothetical protein